jgi:hypothetical protein
VLFFLVGGIAFTVSEPGIWIGQIWIAVAIFLALVYFGMSRRADSAAKLKATGLPGTADILQVSQTGTYVNNQPRVHFRLRIQAQGVTPFETEKTVTVPQIALGALTSGRPLTVYLDPVDHNKFAIDWFGPPRTSTQAAAAQAGLS